MKKFLIIMTAFFIFQMTAFTQNIDNNSGKTYYDTNRTKLKEVYSYKEVSTFSVTGDHTVANVTQKKTWSIFLLLRNWEVKNFREF